MANYISKYPKGKKRYSPSRNLIIPEAKINDYKYTYKKVYALSRNQGDKEGFEKLYLKKEGVKAGVPDIVLPVLRCTYHGLYIELKVGRNKTSLKQKE